MKMKKKQKQTQEIEEIELINYTKASEMSDEELYSKIMELMAIADKFHPDLFTIVLSAQAIGMAQEYRIMSMFLNAKSKKTETV